MCEKVAQIKEEPRKLPRRGSARKDQNKIKRHKNQKLKSKSHFAPAYCNPLFTTLYLFPQQNSVGSKKKGMCDKVPATNMPTPLGGPRLTESLDFLTDRSRMFQRLRLSEIVTFCQAGTAEQPRHGRGRNVYNSPRKCATLGILRRRSPAA